MKRKVVGLRGTEFANRIIENVTEFEIVESDAIRGIVRKGEVEYEEGITEKQFYALYLSMRGAINELKNKTGITDLGIEVMVEILTAPDNWTMTSAGKDGKHAQLAEKLNRTRKSIYSILHKLKTAGFLEDTEDGELRPASELLQLKKALAVAKPSGDFCLSYVLNIIIKTN